MLLAYAFVFQTVLSSQKVQDNLAVGLENIKMCLGSYLLKITDTSVL